jgi:hypothetical protein
LTIAALGAIGAWLRGSDYPTAGGLLIFVAVGIVPLLVYSIEDAMGLWPADAFGADADYHDAVAPAWVAVEVAAITACLAVLGSVRFPLLIAQAAFWAWLLAMDLTRVVRRSEDWSWDAPEQAIGLGFGLVLLGLGVWRRRRGLEGEAFWLALSGHAIAFLHATALGLAEGGLPTLLYLVFYLAVVVASVWLQSRTYLVFGALGCYGYVSYLAFSVFDGALGFTVALALIGLAIVLGAVAFQQYLRPRLETAFGTFDRRSYGTPTAGG